MLTNEQIEKLESKGFRRWTKGNYDRLYINSKDLGLYVEKYKTGNISYAEIDGEKIPNSKAGRLLSGKNFIDVKTGKITACCEAFDEKIQNVLNEARR